MQELLPRLKGLLLLARHYDIGMSMDAEESDRLEISLDLLEALAFDPDLADWNGIGFVVQSYLEALPVRHRLPDRPGTPQQSPLMVRLVKGAYWDSGDQAGAGGWQAGYPVFTRKVYTDMLSRLCEEAAFCL